MNCQYCGSPIPPNTTSCPACGARCEVQPAPVAQTTAPAPDGLVDLYIVGLLDQSKKVDAIKMICGITGWSLIDAKKSVEGNLTPHEIRHFCSRSNGIAINFGGCRDQHHNSARKPGIADSTFDNGFLCAEKRLSDYVFSIDSCNYLVSDLNKRINTS